MVEADGVGFAVLTEGHGGDDDGGLTWFGPILLEEEAVGGGELFIEADGGGERNGDDAPEEVESGEGVGFIGEGEDGDGGASFGE